MLGGLEVFGFTALWSPYFMGFIILIGVLYWYVTGKLRHKFKDASPVPTKQKFYFYTGLVIIYIAQGSPLDLAGHLMFTFHMTSMALAYIIGAPLIWLGLPGWLVRPAIDRLLASPLKFLLHPIVTLFSFNVFFSLYHHPAIHDTIMAHFALYCAYYILLYLTAFMMWWPIAGPLQEYVSLTGFKKIGYMFAAGALMTPACALIIFAKTPVYATYNDPMAWARALALCVPGDPRLLLEAFKGPEIYNLLSPVNDQQLGGVLMKLVQEFIYGGILYSIFKAWFKNENHSDQPDQSADESEYQLNQGQLNRA